MPDDRHTCPDCGHETTDWTLETLGGRCPVCNQQYREEFGVDE